MDYLMVRRRNKWVKVAYLLQRRSPKFSSTKKFLLSNFSDEECYEYFRFTREHLIKLRSLLKLPTKIVCRNGTTVSGVEGLCMLLRRLTYPNRLVDLRHFFGRELSAISRIINKVLDHVFYNFEHLLECSNKPWTNTEALMEYCQAVQDEGAPLANCWGFIDGTVRAMCRPWKYQRQAYNGHKRVHALKYQSVVTPNGLIVDLFGPVEGRRHDSYMLSESNLLETLKQFKSPTGEQLCIYGDPAYPLRPQLMCPYKGSTLSKNQEDFNQKMSKVRVAVEWTFGKITNYFAFCDFKKNQKLFLQPLCKYFKVSALMTNCHTCIYGSQTAEFFELDPPSIEAYLSA